MEKKSVLARMRVAVYYHFVLTKEKLKCLYTHTQKTVKTQIGPATPISPNHSLTFSEIFFPNILEVHLFMCLIHCKADQVRNSLKIVRFCIQIILAELHSKKKNVSIILMCCWLRERSSPVYHCLYDKSFPSAFLWKKKKHEKNSSFSYV